MSQRLINEDSQYLSMRSSDSVKWFSWRGEAFERARREDKPVFLHIGYVSSRSCAVMGQQCFKDEELAAVLNSAFIPVVVDRDTRPDIANIYMRFCTALSGSGGWPLTLILTPEQKPFFTAKYLPRDSVRGQIGLLPLLTAVAEKWKKESGELIKVAEDVTSKLRAESSPLHGDMDADYLKSAAEQLAASFDEQYGGFGRAPKFPTPQNLIFVMRYAHFSGDKSKRTMVDKTLKQMYRGGIFDHLDGGFFRYSADREWLIPCFEKPLEVNALLALCYGEVWGDGHMAAYRQVCGDTLRFCMEKLKGDLGGYFDGRDEYLEGVEGAAYLFTPAEIEDVLGKEDGRHFCEAYDITQEGNIKGKSIPNLLLNERWSFVSGYEKSRKALSKYRQGRNTCWVNCNVLAAKQGMMLMALAKAAALTGSDEYRGAALSLAEYIKEAFSTTDGELTAQPCERGEKNIARLDDYVFCALALLELYTVDLLPEHIVDALKLAESVLRRFRSALGGFDMNPKGFEELVLTPKEIFDGETPSGNSAAAMLFARLYALTGDVKWKGEKDALLKYIRGCSGQYPAACPMALCAALTAVYPTHTLVCVSPSGSVPDALKALLLKNSLELTVLMKTPINGAKLADVAPFTSKLETPDDKPSYYVFTDGVCQGPIRDIG